MPKRLIEDDDDDWRSIDQSESEKEEEEEEDQLLDDEDEIEEAELEAYQEMKGNKEGEEIQPIINKQSSLEKLEEIKLKLPDGKPLPWIETLHVTAGEQKQIIENVHKDTQRETSFYQQTLEGVKIALGKLEELGVKIQRPNDYFAEMIKSDDHMFKLKLKKKQEIEALEAIEEKKKQRQMKKYAKETQRQKLEEKRKVQKDALESVNKWKKKRKLGTEKLDDFPIEVTNEEREEKFAPSKAIQKKGIASPSEKKGKLNKTQAKALKYGFGGRKRFSKKNTKDSSNDFSSFNPKIHGEKKNKKNRPGKQKRKGNRR